MNTPISLDVPWQDLLSSGKNSGTLHIPATGGEVECSVSEAGPIACHLERMTYRNERMRTATPQQLTQVGNELCRRVNYLVEPLAVIETDSTASSVQLRSAPPQQLESEVRYFEVSLNRERGVEVERISAPRGEDRSSVGAPLTREVLARLAEDCVGSVEKVLG